MSLNQIQRYIFYNLVRDHIRIKRPIGSKILAKKLKKFSPPTLRIYFRQLIKEGYLRNVDDFSGREPTEKGWHYYLENYDLLPEIDVNFKTSFEEFLELLSLTTKNIVFLKDGNSSKFIFKGIKICLAEFDDKKLLSDLGGVLENLEKILSKINKELEVLIGKEIEESETGRLSLLVKKTKDIEIGFLGHKINFYHTLHYILKKI